MAEQIIEYGTLIGFDANNPGFAIITDGYYTLKVYISKGIQLQIGRSYHIYKKGSTYYIGAEVTI